MSDRESQSQPAGWTRLAAKCGVSGSIPVALHFTQDEL